VGSPLSKSASCTKFQIPLNQNEENSLDFHLSIPAISHAIVCIESDWPADCSSWRSVDVCLSIVSGLAFPESGRAFIAQNTSITNTEARERGFARVALLLSLRFWTAIIQSKMLCKVNLPVTMHPRPSESLIPNPVMQNVGGGSPPPIRVCPSLS
jgi:hypothetical protein